MPINCSNSGPESSTSTHGDSGNKNCHSLKLLIKTTHAYGDDDKWLDIEASNNIPRTTAYRWLHNGMEINTSGGRH